MKRTIEKDVVSIQKRQRQEKEGSVSDRIRIYKFYQKRFFKKEYNQLLQKATI